MKVMSIGYNNQCVTFIYFLSALKTKITFKFAAESHHLLTEVCSM